MSISKFITRGIRIFDGIINSFATLAAILILFLVASILYEVVMRYFIGRVVLWTFEVTQYCLLFITFLATAWLLKEEGHVRMDLLLGRLKLKNQAMLNTVTSCLGALMFLTVTWYSARVVWQTSQTGYYLPTVLEILAAPILVIIPIGSFLLSIQFLRRAFGFLSSWKATGET